MAAWASLFPPTAYHLAVEARALPVLLILYRLRRSLLDQPNSTMPLGRVHLSLQQNGGGQ